MIFFRDFHFFFFKFKLAFNVNTRQTINAYYGNFNSLSLYVVLEIWTDLINTLHRSKFKGKPVCKTGILFSNALP